MRSIVAVVFVALAFGAGPVRAEHEGVEEHAKHPTHTVVLDTRDIRPAAITMDQGDALVFENHSLQPIAVAFTEPADLKDKIRCGLVKPSADSKSQAPWQLFAWDNGTLRGVIPPGRFASVCSLAAGTYAFTTQRQGPQASGSAGTLPPKGQVTVR